MFSSQGLSVFGRLHQARLMVFGKAKLTVVTSDLYTYRAHLYIIWSTQVDDSKRSIPFTEHRMTF